MELESAHITAHYSILEQQDLVEHVSSHHDVTTGGIEILVEPRACQYQSGLGVQADVRNNLLANLADEAGLWPVTLTVVDTLPVGDDYVYGGVRLSTCTTGFSVINGSTRGILTAGHCDDTQRYDDRMTLTFQSAYVFSLGDFQWHTSAETERDDFYPGPGWSLRDVSGIGPLPSKDQPLCKNGKTTGRTCDAVLGTGYCDDGVCAQVAMKRRLASGGDSGRPWYYDRTAYGIHHGPGCANPTHCEVDMFSHVTYVDNIWPSMRIATS